MNPAPVAVIRFLVGLAAFISERDIRIRRFGQSVRGKRDLPRFDRSRYPPEKDNFVATIARPWQGNWGQYAAIIFESGQTFPELRAWTMGFDPLTIERRRRLWLSSAR